MGFLFFLLCLSIFPIGCASFLISLGPRLYIHHTERPPTPSLDTLQLLPCQLASQPASQPVVKSTRDWTIILFCFHNSVPTEVGSGFCLSSNRAQCTRLILCNSFHSCRKQHHHTPATGRRKDNHTKLQQQKKKKTQPTTVCPDWVPDG